MRYIPHTEDDVRAMLAAIGEASVEALFASIPEKDQKRYGSGGREKPQ